jgi:hypothetical protein
VGKVSILLISGVAVEKLGMLEIRRQIWGYKMSPLVEKVVCGAS